MYNSTIFSNLNKYDDGLDVNVKNGIKLLSKFTTSTEENDLVLLEEKGHSLRKPKILEALSLSDGPFLQEHGKENDKSLSYEAALRSLQELTQSPAIGSIVCPSPYFTPIYDKIVPLTSNNTSKTAGEFSSSRKIPRIIHVSFNDRCVPNELAESITRWQETLPDHSIFFHDDQAVQRLIGTSNDKTQLWHFSEHFPELQGNMRCVKFKGAMLIDIWRMLIVWTYGGIYTDIDNWPGTKFNAQKTIQDGDSFFSLSDVRDRPSQWFFGMAPNHPIAIFTLQEISRRLLRIKNIAFPRVVAITGPQALKMGFRKFNLLLDQNSTIFGKSSYFTQVQQIGSADTSQYAIGNLGGTYDEIVDCFVDESSNKSYVNITKRTKTELLSGIIHWTREVRGGRIGSLTRGEYIEGANITTISANNEQQSVDKFDGLSCRDYLASLK